MANVTAASELKRMPGGMPGKNAGKGMPGKGIPGGMPGKAGLEVLRKPGLEQGEVGPQGKQGEKAEDPQEKHSTAAWKGDKAVEFLHGGELEVPDEGLREEMNAV
jgi:hypothetical protein